METACLEVLKLKWRLLGRGHGDFKPEFALPLRVWPYQTHTNVEPSNEKNVDYYVQGWRQA
eukprot:739624-Pyramimonas_sp.AAC.1